eukprot:gnl/Chilomastix_cuspidata/2019.p1 GENE.gnl/Chilomastix_cuspidata/2019~~gnl/Chilomastix_cuspidata/2019.p1  ORF type:complete len:825 (+),score=124.49 gnl/Chilomastix_cuspidata/2019:2-2476(+)
MCDVLLHAKRGPMRTSALDFASAAFDVKKYITHTYSTHSLLEVEKRILRVRDEVDEVNRELSVRTKEHYNVCTVVYSTLSVLDERATDLSAEIRQYRQDLRNHTLSMSATELQPYSAPEPTETVAPTAGGAPPVVAAVRDHIARAHPWEAHSVVKHACARARAGRLSRAETEHVVAARTALASALLRRVREASSQNEELIEHVTGSPFLAAIAPERVLCASSLLAPLSWGADQFRGDFLGRVEAYRAPPTYAEPAVILPELLAPAVWLARLGFEGEALDALLEERRRIMCLRARRLAFSGGVLDFVRRYAAIIFGTTHRCWRNCVVLFKAKDNGPVLLARCLAWVFSTVRHELKHLFGGGASVFASAKEAPGSASEPPPLSHDLRRTADYARVVEEEALTAYGTDIDPLPVLQGLFKPLVRASLTRYAKRFAVGLAKQARRDVGVARLLGLRAAVLDSWPRTAGEPPAAFHKLVAQTPTAVHLTDTAAFFATHAVDLVAALLPLGEYGFWDAVTRTMRDMLRRTLHEIADRAFAAVRLEPPTEMPALKPFTAAASSLVHIGQLTCGLAHLMAARFFHPLAARQQESPREFKAELSALTAETLTVFARELATTIVLFEQTTRFDGLAAVLARASDAPDTPPAQFEAFLRDLRVVQDEFDERVFINATHTCAPKVKPATPYFTGVRDFSTRGIEHTSADECRSVAFQALAATLDFVADSEGGFWRVSGNARLELLPNALQQFAFGTTLIEQAVDSAPEPTARVVRARLARVLDEAAAHTLDPKRAHAELEQYTPAATNAAARALTRLREQMGVDAREPFLGPKDVN